MLTASRRTVRVAGVALCVAGLFLADDAALGEDGSWATRASMSTPRFAPGATTYDGKIYVVGGATGGNGSELSSLEVYDPATNSWTPKASMPTARANPSFVAVGGLLYAIGGGANNAEFAVVEAYDPVADTWETKASLPEKSYGHAAAVLDGKIYVMGGGNSDDGLTMATVLVYDPQDDTWTTGPSMLSARLYFPAAVADGLIYVMGGYNSQEGANLTGVESFDPTTGQWTARADLPTVQTSAAAAAIDGKIYTAGGQIPGGSGENLTTLQVYDTSSDSWQTGPSMGTGRGSAAGVALNGVFYVMGGATSTGITDSVEAFTPLVAPAAPAGLSAAAISGSEVQLSWTDTSANETGFELERRTGDGAFASVTTTAGDTTGFTDSGLSQCTSYSYRVRAVNAAGASAYSAEATATTPDTTPPVITAPSTVTLVTDCAGSALTITPATLGFTASDNCDPTPALSCSPTSVSPGMTTVDCTATDDAGNVAHASVNVTVLRGPFVVRFLSPLDDTVDNLIKAGQTVPLKISVSCGSDNETGATVAVHCVDQIDSTGTSVANTVPEDSGLANDGGNAFRLADGQYVYNLSTKGWVATSGARFRVRVRIQETGHVDTFAEVVLKNR